MRNGCSIGMDWGETPMCRCGLPANRSDYRPKIMQTALAENSMSRLLIYFLKKGGRMMSVEEERKKLLTVKEVAAILRVNTDSVYEFIKAKKLAAVRIGTIKIRPEALEDFIKSSEVQP